MGSMRLRSLAIELSKLESIREKKLELEQYQTDGELAARWITDILAFKDIFDGCRVADLGSGNGILGIGAVLAGAESSFLFETDEDSCSVSKTNLQSLSLGQSVKVSQTRIGIDQIFSEEFDLVITNPPWGRHQLGADRPFLEEILSIGVNAHLMHSAEANHIQPLFEDAGWSTERYGEADFALPASYSHHSRQRGRTRAAFWRLVPP